MPRLGYTYIGCAHAALVSLTLSALCGGKNSLILIWAVRENPRVGSIVGIQHIVVRLEQSTNPAPLKFAPRTVGKAICALIVNC